MSSYGYVSLGCANYSHEGKRTMPLVLATYLIYSMISGLNCYVGFPFYIYPSRLQYYQTPHATSLSELYVI